MSPQGIREGSNKSRYYFYQNLKKNQTIYEGVYLRLFIQFLLVSLKQTWKKRRKKIVCSKRYLFVYFELVILKQMELPFYFASIKKRQSRVRSLW